MPIELQVAPLSIFLFQCQSSFSIRLKGLIGRFFLTICLWVLDQARDGFDAKVVIEGLEALIDKLSVFVGHDCVRHPKPTHYVLPYKILDILGRYGG